MFYDLIDTPSITSFREVSLKAVRLVQSTTRRSNLWILPVYIGTQKLCFTRKSFQIVSLPGGGRGYGRPHENALRRDIWGLDPSTSHLCLSRVVSWKKLWSLLFDRFGHSLNSILLAQSRIGIKKCVFNKPTIKACCFLVVTWAQDTINFFTRGSLIVRS